MDISANIPEDGNAPAQATARAAQKLGKIVLVLSILFFAVWWVFGKYFDLMDNATCFRLLGCNAGFFGYDALVHFCGGITEAFYIFWIIAMHPRLNPFHGKFHEHFWKNFFIFIAIMVFIGFSWEILEFSYDHYRMDILRENLVYPNHLAQPSNADTMGDISFGVLGAAFTVIGFGITNFFNKIGQ